MEADAESIALERFRQACSTLTNAMTVQLFDRQLDAAGVARMEALATGVLVQYDTHHMVVTASHVLDSPAVQRQGAYVLHDQAGFIDLGEFSFVRTDSAGDRIVDDHLDIAVLFLEKDVVEKLRHAGGWDFAALTSVDDEGPAVPCWHLIHGFPVGLTKPTGGNSIERVSLAYFLPLASGSDSNWASDFPDAHLDLEYKLDWAARIVGTDTALALPSPEGFSGCGIWRVRVPEDLRRDDGIQVALAGVVHRFNAATGTIRATRLEAVLSMIFATGDPAAPETPGHDSAQALRGNIGPFG